MTTTTRKSCSIIENDIREIIDNYFMNLNLVIHGKWYKSYYMYTPSTITGLAKRLFSNDYYTEYGEITILDAENKKIKLISFKKEFTQMAKGLEKEIPNYDILIVEDFE